MTAHFWKALPIRNMFLDLGRELIRGCAPGTSEQRIHSWCSETCWGKWAWNMDRSIVSNGSVFLERIKKLVNRLKKISYLNKLPRNTEVRIFLKFRESSGSFLFKNKTKQTYWVHVTINMEWQARLELCFGGPDAYAVWGDSLSKQT